MSATTTVRVNEGLEGVVVADTRVGGVRGEEGFFHYGPHNAAVLAESSSFEAVWHLFAHGALPSAPELAAFRAETSQRRELPTEIVGVLRALADPVVPFVPLNAARTALSAVGDILGVASWLDDPESVASDSLQIASVFPTLVAALWRLHSGEEPVPSNPSLSLAADYLWMVSGVEPTPEQVSALERYLILTMDHGFNASTFTTRVITSTAADVCSAAVGGIGALSGPLHGGAPSRVLEMLDEIGSIEEAPGWVRSALDRGDRIMGFGHRVYRTDDPRAALLRRTSGEFGTELDQLAARVEHEVLQALELHRPDRQLRTNVEYFAAPVLHNVGLPRQLFTPTFAVSRMVGWLAHASEQVGVNRLIRPRATYVGDPVSA